MQRPLPIPRMPWRLWAWTWSPDSVRGSPVVGVRADVSGVRISGCLRPWCPWCPSPVVFLPWDADAIAHRRRRRSPPEVGGLWSVGYSVGRLWAGCGPSCGAWRPSCVAASASSTYSTISHGPQRSRKHSRSNSPHDGRPPRRNLVKAP